MATTEVSRADGGLQIVIEPPAGWEGLRLRELWRFRDLLLTLGSRDLKVRYKQTVLGVAWVVLQPLIGAGILTFVFGGVAKLEAPGGVPYFLFSFVGMMAWRVFSTTLTTSSQVLVSNAHLVQKVYFPRLILPLSTSLTVLVDLVVVSLMAVVLLLLYWHLPGSDVLLFPLATLLLLMLAMGVGFWASALAVKYRDIKHIVPVAVQFLLYASPVAYAVTEVPEAYRTLYYLNPLVALLETFRFSILGVGEVPWPFLAYSAALALFAVAGGSFAFRRLEREFADVI